MVINIKNHTEMVNNKFLPIILFFALIGSNHTALAQAFMVDVGYTNQDLNHNDKNTIISVGYSGIVPFYKWCSISIDYGTEVADKHRKGTSLGLELQHNFFAGVGKYKTYFSTSLGLRYQYDRIFFTDNPTIKSHSIGPVMTMQLPELQLFVESGYLWGLNDVNLQTNVKGTIFKDTMNQFILKCGVYIPLTSGYYSRELKKLSEKKTY